MDAFSLRLASDRERLKQLPTRSAGRVELLQMPTAARPRAEIELRYRTADSRSYPSQSRAQTRLVIEFAARYPFVAPVARITTPILHPNVWESGVVCLGSKWIASEGIDLFIQRIARLVSFDALLVNEQSAANRHALVWYQQARRQHPQAFPSDQVNWVDESAQTANRPTESAQTTIGPNQSAGETGNRPAGEGPGRHEIRVCPKCEAKLRLPAGRTGVVACPRCRHEFEART